MPVLMEYVTAVVHWLALKIVPKVAALFFAKSTYTFEPYLPADYGVDCSKHSIQDVIHVETGWKGKSPVGETQWFEQVVDYEILEALAKLDIALFGLKLTG